MKTIPSFLLLVGLATGFASAAAETPTNPPAGPGPAPQVINPVSNALERASVPEPPAQPTNGPTAPSGTEPASSASTATNATVGEVASTNGPSSTSTNAGSKDGLRLNFHNAPLDMVLNYLSEAAGFVIVLDTSVSGRMDVWSNSPVSKEEALDLLNSALNKNGYAAVRNGRILTIVSKDSVKTSNIPVKKGNDPEEIPKNDETVTQVIPVRYISATQLTKDLEKLLPMSATMTANEGANTIIITDTQAHIRRMAEIVRALDTAGTNATSIRVYPLKYADAKNVATVIKDLFQSQDNTQRNANDLRAQFIQRIRGGGPFGGMPGAGTGANESSGSGRVQQPKVVATSDDRSNSLVVSAPDDIIPTIDELVKAIDTNVEDITEVKVFRLKNADPIEMADLLTSLFPDETQSNTGNTRGGNIRFGGGPFGGGFFGGGNRGRTTSQQSDRMLKMGRVIAVADQRTASVVVSASKDLMVQIAAMIEQLDLNPAKKQKVFVYQLENADVQETEDMLRNLFDRSGTMNSRNQQTQQNPLTTRLQQQQQNTTTTGTGTMGGTRGLGGTSF